MAALLKKRALAEYSQVIQEETPRPVKKLRLIQRPPEPDVQLNLQGLSSNEALQVLLKFETSLPVSSGRLGTAVRELLDHMTREKEPLVRGKVANIIASLSNIPGVSAEHLAEELLLVLKKEESHKAQSKMILALSVIGQSAPNQTALHKQLVNIAIQNLSSGSHLVRSACLNLIGSLDSLDPLDKGDNSADTITGQKLLQNHFLDQDSRVRSSSLEALLQMHERGMKLDQTMYKEVCQALGDDYEGVRLSAVQMVWVLAHMYPDSMIPVPGSDEELRLVDDGFVKICNMINDISVKVRTKAASLLGSLHLVSARFLEQTLDKKLMSNMRRKRTAAERAKDNYQSGIWSTGQKWADDAPKEELDPDSVNLMNIGSCGAFVHGLEDEFSEVRNCTLDSMCELACHSPAFALLCQDSIADMFNDEIESVRLNAINSLKKLSNHLELREDQLEIMLGVLQDFSYVSRASLRDMLCEMRLATKECLNTCVVALLENLRRYPEDRVSIWKCMQHLGKNSPDLALPLIPEFLCLHPYFDTPEPEMDDPAYISILVLVYNAAAGNRTALPMFQEHVWRHYTYLRDSIPEMVPELKQKDDLPSLQKMIFCGGYQYDQERSQSKQKSEAVCQPVSVGDRPGSGESHTAGFLQQMLCRLEGISSLDTSMARQLLMSAVRDLERVTMLDPSTSASSECVCLFLQSQLLITQLMSQHAHVVSGSVTVGHLTVLVDKILSLTDQLQTLFLGLSNNDIALVRQTELKALTFRLGSVLATSQELATQMKAQDAYMSYLNSLQGFLTSVDVPVDPFTSYLLSELTTLKSQQLTAAQRVLHSAIKLVRPVTFQLTNKVRKAQATIIEPSRVSDNPVKFTAGLTTAVLMIADIKNLPNLRDLRVMVKYPDTNTVYTVPRPGDIQKQGPLSCQLTTNVLLSHTHWSEMCTVEIGLCVLSSATPMKFRSKMATSEIEREDRVIELCKPVKVLISPKPHKR